MDEFGTWQVDVLLPEGDLNLELQAIGDSGNVLASSPAIPMTILQPVEGGEGGEGGETGAVEDVPPGIDFPAAQLRAGQVSLSGSGAPGALLLILANGQEIGTVEVDEDGRWTLDADLAARDDEIDIAALDEDGTVREVLPAISLPVLPAADEAETPAEGAAETPAEGAAETPLKARRKHPLKARRKRPLKARRKRRGRSGNAR